MLGCWIPRSPGEGDKNRTILSEVDVAEAVMFGQDRAVNCNLPLLQPEFVSKIDFAEGEERRNLRSQWRKGGREIFGHFCGELF